VVQGHAMNGSAGITSGKIGGRAGEVDAVAL
jgi:hypothetical protein